MADSLPGALLVRAAQVAREAEVRQSPNGVSFATFGETGVEAIDLDRMLEAVPTSITAALKGNTYYFVPLALREKPEALEASRKTAPEPAMVANGWSGDLPESLSEAAICHRNVELGAGHRGVFISTRLMGDRFALSFEFFINVAHAFADVAGVPAAFADLVWQQALANVRGETSFDAWESRHFALGRRVDDAANYDRSADRPADQPVSRRNRAFASVNAAAAEPVKIDEKERALFVEAAFADAVAIYLLSLALDFDYSELREREYPLLAPSALAARLKLIAELFPPNAGYEFAVRYRRRA